MMKRVKLVLSIVLLLGVSTLYVTHQRRAMKALERKQSSLSETLAAVEQNAREARVEQVALTALTQRLAPVITNATAPPSVEAAAMSKAGRGEDAPPSPPAEPQAYVASIDSSFANESADRVWSRLADAAVRAPFAESDDRSLRSVECRSSMCRVVTEDEGLDEAREKVRKVVANPLNELLSGAYVSQLDGGTPSHPQRVTYFFRKGVSLPVL